MIKAKSGQATIGDKPVQAKNIAVLVRSSSQAELVKQALLELGIASVYLSDKSNVFESVMARDLYQILNACADPLNESKLLTALASSIFSLDAAELYQLKQDENLWEQWVTIFVDCQKQWRRQGILAMLHQLFLEQGISQKLLAQPQGERNLTDLLHLAELLQQASRLHLQESALLRWFERQLQDKERLDAQIRLESERDLVKIVTIHKSKGLAYDLVWLPFIALSGKAKPADILSCYYDEASGKMLWDMDQTHQKQWQKEEQAEDIRLLYVALTRAKYQVVMGLPTEFSDKWNALLYCLTQGNMTKDAQYQSKKLISALNQRIKSSNPNMPEIQLENAELLQASAPLDWQESDLQLNCAEFKGHIENNWLVSSFSHLLSEHQRLDMRSSHYQQLVRDTELQIYDEAIDHDLSQNLNPIQTTDLLLEETHNDEQLERCEDSQAEQALYSPHSFPSGAAIGTALHGYFENTEFSQLAELENIDSLSQKLQLSEDWQPVLQQWFSDIATTPLLAQSSLCLAQLAPEDCLHELQFYLKLGQAFDTKSFNTALKNHHKLEFKALNVKEFKGMLRGFIDLVFRHNGKYYLLDYKSNFLGLGSADYSQQKIEQAMLEHHYDWQYLLYSLALHRYLKQRDPQYSYESHFGGAIYLFLRGMNGKNQQGVFF